MEEEVGVEVWVVVSGARRTCRGGGGARGKGRGTCKGNGGRRYELVAEVGDKLDVEPMPMHHLHI